MATVEPAQTRNHDVVGLCNRIKQFAYEFHKSQSHGVLDVRAADRARFGQMVGALKAYKAWIVSQPELDMPETAPRMMSIEAWTEADFSPVENNAINDLLNLLYVLWNEMLRGQSSALGNSLYAFDANRFDLVIAKIESFLSDYIDVIQPLDLPESTPAKASAGPGRTGVV